MGLGIIEPRDGKHCSGTVRLLEKAPDAIHFASASASHRKRVGGDSTVILVPQPSNSPNDPLNWSLRKRDVMLLILCYASVMAATMGPILATNTLLYTSLYRVSFTKVALLSGYHLVGVGVAGVFCSATARYFGKRVWYLFGLILLVVGSAWAAASTSYTSHLWARVVQGVGVCPFEALVNASVGDLFFTHQRGKRLAFANLSLYGATWITPIITGVLTQNTSWRWPYILVAIFSGVCLLFMFFFVPEHVYCREGDEFMSQYQETPDSSSIDRVEGVNVVNTLETKDSYLQTLRIFTGRKTSINLFKLILRPLVLFLHPAVIWACLTMSSLISFTVGCSTVIAVIFTGPPNFADIAHVGYIYASPFVGAILGFVIAGVFSDWSVGILTRYNGGIYEPEFRLVLSLPMTLFGVAGVFGFGLSYVIRQHWIVPVVFFGFVSLGMVLAAVCSAAYIVDAHREIAVEALVCILLAKNFFGFMFTDLIFGWITGIGVEKTFIIFGIVQIMISLLSVPMYVFGKCNRAFMQRYDLFTIFHLR